MSFAHAWILALIPLVWWILRRRRSRSSVTVAAVEPWAGRTGGRVRYLWLPVFLRRATIVLLLLALARPQAGVSYNVEVTEGIAIQLLVDLSSSMTITVDGPEGRRINRMELAKKMVERFIAGDGETLSGRPNDLIGLITFARYADTRSPLTFGHDALIQIVRSLTIQGRPNEDGTAYGDALALAAARLQQMETMKQGPDAVRVDAIESKVIILLTDGENNSGAHSPREAAGLAKAWGCRVYVVSLGDSMATILGRTSDTSAAPEALSGPERELENIARQTGGIFRRAHDYESLAAVYAEIDRLETTEMATRSFDRVAEYFWLPLGFGLFTLTLALILEATWLRVTP